MLRAVSEQERDVPEQVQRGAAAERHCRCRTLVMIGDDDEVTLEHAAEFYRGLPNAELSIVPGTSHGLLALDPASRALVERAQQLVHSGHQPRVHLVIEVDVRRRNDVPTGVARSAAAEFHPGCAEWMHGAPRTRTVVRIASGSSPLPRGRQRAVTEDVVALSDEELLKRYYRALQAIPRITKDELEARRHAWDDVFRYHDELLHRYPPSTSRRRENRP
jgi:hypothetical protein